MPVGYEYYMLSGYLPHTGWNHLEFIVNDGCTICNVPCYYQANVAPVVTPTTITITGLIYWRLTVDLT